MKLCIGILFSPENILLIKLTVKDILGCEVSNYTFVLSLRKKWEVKSYINGLLQDSSVRKRKSKANLKGHLISSIDNCGKVSFSLNKMF